MSAPANEVTQLLALIREGHPGAEDQLLLIVYEELRTIAARFMRQENAGHTLQTTALVHEAYIRLMGEKSCDFQDRAHFFRAIARTMRRTLVDYARARNAGKRGGDVVHIEIDQALLGSAQPWDDVIALNQALETLATMDPRQVQVVELRFFAGLSVAEVAAILNVTERTVIRDWEFAKAWLFSQIKTSSRSASA